MTAKGLGPWFVGLFFNSSSIKIHVHGNILQYCRVLNALDSREGEWTPMMIIGPFYQLQDALGFQYLWSNQKHLTKSNSLAQGLALAAQYQHDYQLTTWIPPHGNFNFEEHANVPKQVRLKQLLRQRKRPWSIQKIRELKKKRTL